MATTRKKALEHAEQIIAVPRSRLRVVLRQREGGVTLLHNHRVLTRCYITWSGMRAAYFMAQALGVGIPPLGAEVQTEVSTGVLWRAVSISCLDLRKPESWPLLERLLGEATMMRDGAVEGV